jgi:5,5'-dehydrodivanillate O-demethylase
LVLITNSQLRGSLAQMESNRFVMTDTGIAVPISPVRQTANFDELVRSGPGTLAGRYLRSMWQPVYHSMDIAAGEAKPLRIMGQRFTLYRGEAGVPHLVDPDCRHRGTTLSAGRVEGDAIRCFYHGWKYDCDGRCVEQPAEESRFADKVRIRTYPVRDYLGLLFAYLGDGEAPEFPLYPEFEHFDGLLEIDSYERRCNYFQNIDNALDHCHLGFVHGSAADTVGDVLGRAIKVKESEWGVTLTFSRASDGKEFISQFGMPNMLQLATLPVDPEIGWLESLFWWVPVDDVSHIQFSLHRVPATGETARRTHERRQARKSEIDLAHQDVAEEILGGRLRLSDVDPKRCDMIRLQDDIALVGQGRVVDRQQDLLGISDVGVAMVRRIWQRELRAFAEGRAPKAWKKTTAIRPAVWGLGGTPEQAAPGSASPQLFDVRPFVEIGVQMKALGGPIV